jgi:hypothetical protein
MPTQVGVPDSLWESRDLETPTALPDGEESTRIAIWVSRASARLGYDVTASRHVRPMAEAHQLWHLYSGHPVRDPETTPGDPEQAWFWSGSWQERESEADADIAAGRVRQFDSMEELFADIDDSDE